MAGGPSPPRSMQKAESNGTKFYSQRMFPKQTSAVAAKKKEVPQVLFEMNLGDKEKRA